MCILKLTHKLFWLAWSWEDKHGFLCFRIQAQPHAVICCTLLRTNSDADSKRFVKEYILILQNSNRKEMSCVREPERRKQG